MDLSQALIEFKSSFDLSQLWNEVQYGFKSSFDSKLAFHYFQEEKNPNYAAVFTDIMKGQPLSWRFITLKTGFSSLFFLFPTLTQTILFCRRLLSTESLVACISCQDGEE